MAGDHAPERYHAVGLALDPNEIDPTESTPLLLNDLPPERKRGAGMSLNEAQYLQKLIQKHGDDVTAMARNIKLNYDQKTPGELRRRLAVYKLVYGDVKTPIKLYIDHAKGSLPFRYHDPRPVTEVDKRARVAPLMPLVDDNAAEQPVAALKKKRKRN